MLCGISPWHVRVLCENPFHCGLGRQYTPSDVGEMTLDQIFFLLADIQVLRAKKTREMSVDPLSIVPGKDGNIKGRAVDGSVIKAKIKGESLAARLNRELREKMEKEEKERQEQKRRRRRSHHGN